MLVPGLITAAIVGLVGSTASSLAKVCLDSVIQHELPEASRASAFGLSETVLQLSWVFGGVVGLLIGGVWTFGHDSVYAIGFAVVTVLLVVGLIQSWLVRNGQSLFPWLDYPKLAGKFRKGKGSPSGAEPTAADAGRPGRRVPDPGRLGPGSPVIRGAARRPGPHRPGIRRATATRVFGPDRHPHTRPPAAGPRADRPPGGWPATPTTQQPTTQQPTTRGRPPDSGRMPAKHHRTAPPRGRRVETQEDQGSVTRIRQQRPARRAPSAARVAGAPSSAAPRCA